MDKQIKNTWNILFINFDKDHVATSYCEENITMSVRLSVLFI